MTFELLNHKEFFEKFQGINLNEFQFENDENLLDEKIIEKFIHSHSFKEDCLTDRVRNDPEPNDKYLRQAFEIDNVSFRDFKTLTKEKLINYLNEYFNLDDWGDLDRNDFEIIKNQFFEFIKDENINSFYLIDK